MIGLSLGLWCNRRRGTPSEPVAPSAFSAGQWSATGANTAINVTISSLPSSGGSTITAVQYRLNGGSWVGSGGTGSFTISGLTNGTTYTVELRAVNAIGNGADSDDKTATPATVPSAPTLTATPSDGEVTLNLTDGATGGSAITHRYIYRSLTDGFTPGPGNLLVTDPTLPYADTDVTNDTAYYYRAIAENAVGLSAASTQQTATPSAATGGTFTGEPAISGTRGGTLTATNATYSGTDTLSGQWYLDDVPTGDTDTSFTDSDTSKSVEYRNTLATSGETVSAYRGVVASAPLYQSNFAAAADGTPLRSISPWTYAGDSAGIDNYRVYDGVVRKSATYPYEGFSTDSFPLGVASYIIDTSFNIDDTLRPILNIGGKGATLRSGTFRLESTSVNYENAPLDDGFHNIRIVVDDVEKKIIVYVDGLLVPFSGGGFSFTGETLADKFGIELNNNTYMPIGSDILGEVTAYDLTKIQVLEVGFEPVGISQSKMLAHGLNRVSGSTSSQYRIERQSGEMVQGWTSTTQVGSAWSFEYTIPQDTLEAEILVVKVRNVGGAVSIASASSPLSPVHNSQPMRISMNASGTGTYDGNSPFRDLAKGAQVTLQPITWGLSARSVVGSPGSQLGRWSDWADEYNPALTYPHSDGPTGNDGNQAGMRVMYQGIQFQPASTVNNNIPINTPPDLAVHYGGPWVPTDSGYAEYDLIFDPAGSGLIVKHPDDVNRETQFEFSWSHPQAEFPFTIQGSSTPGAVLKFNLKSNWTLTSPVDANGDFEITVTGDTDDSANRIIVDRTGPVVPSLSLIPSYETGTGLVSDVYLADLAPFASSHRNMSGTGVNQNVTMRSVSSLARRLKPVQVGWSGEAQWEFELELAKKLGDKPMYVNTKYFDPDDYLEAWAETIAADTDFTNTIDVEFSNENWQSGNPAFDQGHYLTQDAATAGISRELMHSRKSRHTIQIFKDAFVGQVHRIRGVLAWQTFISIETWQAMLDFENCYQVINEISTAPYHSTQVMDYGSASTAVKNAITANDYAAYVIAITADITASIPGAVAGVKTLWDWIPNYCISKGLPKDAIRIGSYELNHHVEVKGSWPDGARARTFWNTFKTSSNMSVLTALYIDSMAAECPHFMRFFDYCGIAGRTTARLSTDSSGWGLMKKTGNLSDHPMSAVIERATHYNAL